MKPTLAVLAAGMGSRYGGLKQVDPVGPNGEIVLDYSIYDAQRAGFGKVVFVIREDLEQTFRNRFDKSATRNFKIDYAFQKQDDLPPGHKSPPDRIKPWGTGHAVLAARDAITEPFAVINADDFYGPESFHLLARHLTDERHSNGADKYTMVGFRLRNTLSPHGAVSRGICAVDNNGYLQKVEEHTEVELRPDGVVEGRDPGGLEKRLDDDAIVSMNMWGFSPSFLQHLQNLFAEFLDTHNMHAECEFYLPAAVDQLIQAGKCHVKVQVSSEEWFGVTYREDRESVQQRIAERIEAGIYPANTLPGPGLT